MKRFNKFILVLMLFFTNGKVFGADYKNIITVDFNKRIGRINRMIFGNNFLGFDISYRQGKKRHHYGHCDYGAGLWDGKLMCLLKNP